MLFIKKIIKIVLSKIINILSSFLYKLEILNFFLNNLYVNKINLIEKVNQSHYIKNILKKKIICLDVGSKGGIQKELLKYKKFLNFICIEPNDFREYKNKKFIDKPLWNKEINRKFYITKNPYGSSLYPPDLINFKFYYNNKKYISMYEIDEIKNLKCGTLEKELNKLNVKEIDYLKIDTQGSELNILKGLGKFKPLAINLELQTISIYKGAPNWIKVMKKLDELGYICTELKPIGSHETHIPIMQEGLFLLNYQFKTNAKIISNRLREYVSLLIIHNQIKYLNLIKSDLNINFETPLKDPFFK